MVRKISKTGDMLGELTDELSGKAITQFVSTGQKSYSFKYGDNQQKSTIKGFTLKHENNRPNRLTQCCTQFKPFGNKTFCFKNFHII